MNSEQQSLVFERQSRSLRLNKKNPLTDCLDLIILSRTEQQYLVARNLFDKALKRCLRKNHFYGDLKRTKSIILEARSSLKRQLNGANAEKILWYYHRTSVYPEVQEQVKQLLIPALELLSILKLSQFYTRRSNSFIVKKEIERLLLKKLSQKFSRIKGFFLAFYLKIIFPKQSDIGKKIRGLKLS